MPKHAVNLLDVQAQFQRIIKKSPLELVECKTIWIKGKKGCPNIGNHDKCTTDDCLGIDQKIKRMRLMRTLRAYECSAGKKVSDQSPPARIIRHIPSGQAAILMDVSKEYEWRKKIKPQLRKAGVKFIYKPKFVVRKIEKKKRELKDMSPEEITAMLNKLGRPKENPKHEQMSFINNEGEWMWRNEDGTIKSFVECYGKGGIEEYEKELIKGLKD